MIIVGSCCIQCVYSSCCCGGVTSTCVGVLWSCSDYSKVMLLPLLLLSSLFLPLSHLPFSSPSLRSLPPLLLSSLFHLLPLIGPPTLRMLRSRISDRVGQMGLRSVLSYTLFCLTRSPMMTSHQITQERISLLHSRQPSTSPASPPPHSPPHSPPPPNLTT